MNTEKLLMIIQNTFRHRNDTIGSTISRDVEACISYIRAQKLSKEEIQALAACYQTAYNDSSNSTSSLIALTPVLLGLNPVLDMIPLSGCIMLYLKGVIYAVLLFYILRQIWKTSRDNAVLRNHIMASSILLAEMDSSEYVTKQT